MKLRLGRIPAHYFIFFSSLALFLFSLQRNFSAAHDSITYLNHISEGKNLFHPHHLLYNFISRGWLLAGQILFPAASDYILIEMLSAVFGSAVVTTCFLFFRNRAKLSPAFSSVGTAVIAFSYGVWSYSSNIEVYAPPLFFSLLVLYSITNPILTSRRLFLAAIYTSIAILFHQVHVLLFLVCLVYLGKRVKLHQLVITYFLPVFLLTVIIYFFVAFKLEELSSFNKFISWATLYAHGHDYWRAPGIGSFLLVLAGFMHAFFGGQFLFRLPIESFSQSSVFQGHNLADEKFLIRNLQPWQALILSVLMLVALLLMLKLVIHYFKYRGFKNNALRPLQYTFILYSFFFFFWMPENLEFWILQSVLFWIILFSTYEIPIVKKQIIEAGVIATCLFIINYGGSIFWLQEKENDWYYSAVQPLIPTAISTDLVVTRDAWIMRDYVYRFTDCRQPENDNQKNLMIDINKTLQEGSRVFVINAQDQHSAQSKAIDSMLQSFSMRIKLFSPDEPKIYVIR